MNQMFSLTVAVGQTAWSLLFKTKEAATAARDKLTAQRIEPPPAFGYDVSDSILIVDDFGQEASIWPARIHGLLLEDMDASKFAHVERGLHSARTQKQFEQRAANDPVLKVAAQMSGPGIISPFASNGRGLS